MKYLPGAVAMRSALSLQFLVAALMAVSLAYLVGNEEFVPAMAVVITLYALIFYAGMTRAASPGIRDLAFWGMLILMLAVPLWRRAVGGQLFGFSVTGILELWLIAFAPLTVPSVIDWIKHSRFARVLMYLLAFFLTVAVLSTVFGRKTSLAGVSYQFLSNLKFLFMIAVGFYLAWSPRTEAVFWSLVRWLWLPLSMLVIWRWVSPGTYILSPKHFGTPMWLYDAAAHFLGFPSKATGPFVHPLYLGYLGAILMLFSLIRALVQQQKSFLLVALCYFCLLLASGQKGELAAVLVATPIVLSAVLGRRRFLPSMLVTTVILSGMVLWALNTELVQHALRSWAIIGDRTEIFDISSTYGVMYWHAYYIANEYSPLGSGLGTFAGLGAAKFDTSFYVDRGFGNYWWWNDRNVLTDTVWPNFVAETGWFGALVMLSIVLGLIAYACNEALKSRDSRIRLYWLAAFAGLLFTFLNSPTSASLQNPGLFFLPAVFLGIAYNLSCRSRTDERKSDVEELLHQPVNPGNP